MSKPRLELFLRQRALGEERFHQRFVGFRDHFDQPGTGLVGRLREGGRDVALGHRAGAVVREGERPHPHQIHHAAEVALLAYGELNRHDLPGAVAVQCGQRPLEAGALPVEPGQDHDARKVGGRGIGPQLLGLHLDAVHRVDHHHRSFGHP